MKRLLTLGLFLALVVGCSKPARPPRPHTPVILISIDTLRADAVSGFGAPPEQTPELLKFGDESIRFETAISATHLTTPSHATMLTGFSPFAHGCATGGPQRGTKQAWHIAPKIATIAEIFSAQGWKTSAFTDGVQLLPSWGFARGFDTFDHVSKGLTAKLPEIEQFLAGQSGKPFFLFLHTYRAHHPYRPPQDLLENLLKDYQGIYRAPTRRIATFTHEKTLKQSKTRNLLIAELEPELAKTDEDRQFMKKLYMSGVTGADREFGGVIDLLKKHDLYDKSIIVVTSDHGEAFYEHGEWSHTTIYDECVRVPLIIRLPGQQGSGIRIRETFPAVSLAPTLLDLSGLGVRTHFEGRSVADEMLLGTITERPAYLGWCYQPGAQFPSGKGVRTRAGKYMELDTTPPLPVYVEKLGKSMCFDLGSDPSEMTNIINKGASIEQSHKKSLEDANVLWDLLRKLYYSNNESSIPLTEEQIRDLQGIGYLK